MSASWRVLLCAAIAGLVACGGRYEEPGSGSSDPAPGSPGSARGGKAGSSSASTPLPSHDLGDCKPGFDRAEDPTRPCNWSTDAGMCFDSKDAACACICPTNRDSVCYSDFSDGPGSGTPVHCD